MGLSKYFYNSTRKTGKIASVLYDIETLLTLNPKKIAKRFVRKKIWKLSMKTTRKLTNKLK